MDESPASSLKEIRRSFLHFLQGVLQIDPTKRWTADQARQHPFITETVLPEGYQPPQPRRRISSMSTSKPRDTSAMRAQGDTCGFYHKFTTALRGGVIIDVATGSPLASLSSPLNPMPSIKPDRSEEIRRFRSKSDAVSHPPDPRTIALAKPQQKPAPPEPMSIATSGTTSTSTSKLQLPRLPVTGTASTETTPATAPKSYETSAAVPIAEVQSQVGLSGSATQQPRLSTSLSTTSAALSSGRQSSGRRSSISESASKKDKKSRRASAGKKGTHGSSGGTGDEPMAMSPSVPNWNPFDLDSSLQEEGASTHVTSKAAPHPPNIQVSHASSGISAFGMDTPHQATQASGMQSKSGASRPYGGFFPQEQTPEARSWSQSHGFLIPSGMQGHQDAHMGGMEASPTSSGMASGRWGGAPPVAIALGGQGRGSSFGIPIPGAGGVPPIALGTSAPQGFNPLDILPPMNVGTQPLQGPRLPQHSRVPGFTVPTGGTAPIPIAGPPRLQGGVGPDSASDPSAV